MKLKIAHIAPDVVNSVDGARIEADGDEGSKLNLLVVGEAAKYFAELVVGDTLEVK